MVFDAKLVCIILRECRYAIGQHRLGTAAGVYNVKCISTFDKKRGKTLSRTLRLFFRTALVITSAALFTSCVSVSLGPGKVEKSSGVRVEEPTAPFVAIDTKADGAWKSKDTGSTIAYQSGCGESADLPLESLAEELFSGLEEKKEISKQRRPFDGREGLDIEIEGKLDGVLTRTRTLVYKKNRCSYTLTFITLPQNLDLDKPKFEKFILGFAAP